MSRVSHPNNICIYIENNQYHGKMTDNDDDDVYYTRNVVIKHALQNETRRFCKKHGYDENVDVIYVNNEGEEMEYMSDFEMDKQIISYHKKLNRKLYEELEIEHDHDDNSEIHYTDGEPMSGLDSDNEYDHNDVSEDFTDGEPMSGLDSDDHNRKSTNDIDSEDYYDGGEPMSGLDSDDHYNHDDSRNKMDSDDYYNSGEPMSCLDSEHPSNDGNNMANLDSDNDYIFVMENLGVIWILKIIQIIRILQIMQILIMKMMSNLNI